MIHDDSDSRRARARWLRSLRRVASAVADVLRPDGRRTSRAPAPAPARSATSSGTYSYAPVDDEHADPGEVVWAWVPFEEDASKGKDRPVLVIGRDDDQLLALQLTSKDHDRDSAQEAAAGRYWMDVGTGGWDRERRPSEARVNRLLRLDRSSVRRSGDRLDEALFEQVLAQVRRYFPQG
ncbi:MAG: type II toxin-antitoxin system PemK/MazF family toxin [Ornithinimicrobium sp.]|uniref:type II toxin-antitoxin system PemK/MazF family toxin n=1 Tax=Ornithinimicrobium sp. TaxID=1977084 RepID=UPI0026E040C6|nr:type II toxin-antitoxin system PemK/MazF family toxin [Ornithinimicrobium sp.]MDO5739753.1 type II toxin-antitoxin system PemK/MazF family toxin [Ornithinimicrobium sp.]